MAVTISNVIRNHRGVYFEVTGDGATTALVVNHMNGVHAGTTASQTFAVTAPSTFERGNNKGGGFVFPSSGTPVPISSVVVTSSQVTVNTTSPIGNGTKAYVAVVFDQYTATE